MPAAFSPRPWVAIALLFCGTAFGQEVKLPQTVSVAVGRLAAIEMSHDGEDFAYAIPPQLDAFREYTTDPKVVKLRVIGYERGSYLITAVATKAVNGKGKLSPFASCLVVVGEGPTPVPPGPTPTPVPPTPPPEPVPPNPPIAGPRQVLILRESANDTPELSRMFISLQSGKARDYLKSKGHACFIFDVDAKGADGQADPTVAKWKAAAESIPALVILDKDGKILAQEPLSSFKTADGVLAFLKANGG